MNPTFAKWTRKLHRVATIAFFAPLAVIIGSGLFLQLKKDVAWIQPSTMTGSSSEPSVSLAAILEAARGVEEAGIESWADVDRLDFRPSKGVVKVRPLKSRYEVQVDTATGEVLQVAYRRSDLIESIHDGSFFHDKAKLWIFLPAGVALLFLWASGLVLWYLPYSMRRAARRRAAARSAP